MLLGAAGNAWLASTQPILTGRAFEAVIAVPSDLTTLGRVALLLGVIQVTRGLCMQLIAQYECRNPGTAFGA